MRLTAAARWGGAKNSDARPGNIPIGLAWGSSYQNRFRRTLTTAQQDAALAKMKANGVTWVRMDAAWWTVQQNSGATYDWSTVDAVVTKLVGAGINVCLLLTQASGWTMLPPNTPPLYAAEPTPDPAKYAVYCAAAVQRYMPMGVTVFELWNEPNLTLPGANQGWGTKLVAGFGGLAVAAYAAMKAADPRCYVLAGTLATASEFGTPGNPRACTWAAVPAGATTATITSTAATAGEAPGFLAGGGWPDGTQITAVAAGASYTVAPPPWTTGGFPAIAAGSGTLQVQNTQLAPDFFLACLYEYAAGRPWCDAVAIHPYTQPKLPSAQLAIYGGWAVVPNMRATMVANGDGAKPMWVTEFGAPSGGIAGTSWPAAAATATSLVVSSTQAAAQDTNYRFLAAGVPAGAWVSAVTPGASWTVRPTTGLTLAAALTAGAATTSITLAATPAGAVTIPTGTVLTLAAPVVSGNFVAQTQQVTTTADVTTATAGTTPVPVASFTPVEAYLTGSVILGLIGQTFGTAITAGTAAAVNLAPQGVAVPAVGPVDEATQAAIITEGLKSIVRGAPGGTGTPGSPAWPYVHGTPVFIYNWADSGDGPFGLERIDGTSKPAMTAVRQAVTVGV
jgi:hypothetical protein